MFSQAEEDDILALLLARHGIAQPTFVEIGVGPGVENNTRALLALGGTGLWIGDEPVHLDVPHWVTVRDQTTVTPDNVIDLLRFMAPIDVDVFSLDIDGNDYWVALRAIPFLDPKIVIVEYYAPAVGAWVMPYTPGYRWQSGEPCGASLVAWRELLEADYELVYTTHAQVNAFFVRRDLTRHRGGDVDDTLQSLIDSLKALAADVAKNEGRPSAQEISNRVGHAVILATIVQQNLTIASTPIDPRLAANVVNQPLTPPPAAHVILPADAAALDDAASAAPVIEEQPIGPGSGYDDEPAVLGAGVGDTAVDDAPDATDPPPTSEP